MGTKAPAARVLVVGEAVVDVVVGADGREVRRPGGSAVNTAVALARLGHRVRLATALGPDDDGALVAQHLRTAGVAFSVDPWVLGRTSTARAVIDDDGSAVYDFDLAWQLPVAPACSSADTDLLHVCSLGALLPTGAGVVHAVTRAAASAVAVSYDVNARRDVPGLPDDLGGVAEQFAACATWVRASDEDLALTHPHLTTTQAAQRLLGCGPRAVVVTEGARGARWCDRAGVVRVPAEPSEVVDTIGAGDSFGAALLDALWWQERAGARTDPTRALEHASRAAAITVGRPGADPPSRDDLGWPASPA